MATFRKLSVEREVIVGFRSGLTDSHIDTRLIFMWEGSRPDVLQKSCWRQLPNLTPKWFFSCSTNEYAFAGWPEMDPFLVFLIFVFTFRLLKAL